MMLCNIHRLYYLWIIVPITSQMCPRTRIRTGDGNLGSRILCHIIMRQNMNFKICANTRMEPGEAPE